MTLYNPDTFVLILPFAFVWALIASTTTMKEKWIPISGFVIFASLILCWVPCCDLPNKTVATYKENGRVMFKIVENQ